MTQDLYSTQQDVLTYLTTTGDFPVYDTELPQTVDEPQVRGYLDPYAVLRFNDSAKLPSAAAVAGPRYDEMYTLIDVLCVAASPEEARELAWGVGGVADVMTGYKLLDGGTLDKTGAGNVFAIGDGTATLPRRFIARVSFRGSVNMAPSA